MPYGLREIDLFIEIGKMKQCQCLGDIDLAAKARVIDVRNRSGNGVALVDE